MVISATEVRKKMTKRETSESVKQKSTTESY